MAEVAELTTIGTGYTDRYLTSDEVRDIVREAIASAPFQGKRVLVIIPDGTRTMPMPQMFDLLQELLRPKVAKLDYLVALGTHPPMTDAQLTKLVGKPVVNGRVGETNIFNHHWESPETFVSLGTIPAAEIEKITNGLLSRDVPVRLNKIVLEYDHIIICGPVFPHEVVGFSGGNKYFFPGIAGSEIINFTHWLGAVITNYEVIGSGYTPVRAVIDRAATMIPTPSWCFAWVVTHEGTSGLFFDKPAQAWVSASQLSARKHIVYLDKPFRRVLSVMPEMYDDVWTAGKGMYKIEPIVADGGEVIIYSPNIDEISYTHGKIIDQVGYHCRDYFMKQWDKFKDFPGGVLAHSTHVKGLGTYDEKTGIEKPRITVTLATSVPEERCRLVNLGYMDPKSINISEWMGREAEGILVVPRAGEVLYRLKK
ncbi:MAG TPA: lactate racemase domain-containing protein [Terriglobales bacterium]|nr:lactate racemase domain-containing protein [Terriglobales bacterium]